MKQNKRIYQTAVIGAGASGLMASIGAAAYSKDVLLLEKNTRPGKKLLSTGNGKCNFTNEEQGLSCYRGDDPAFVLPVFSQFGKTELLSFLKDLGVLPFERNGYYYPFSGQASSVLEVLEAQVKFLRITVVCGSGVRTLEKKGEMFFLTTETDTYLAKTCVLAAGSLAAPSTGSDGFGLLAARRFHHTIVQPHPALVPLLCSGKFLKTWAGVRAQAKVSLRVDDVVAASDMGEVQLTKEGISGIPVFQISRFASDALERRKKVVAELDFLPQMTRQEASAQLFFRCFESGKNKTLGDALTGLVHRKLHGVLAQAAGLNLTEPLSLCTRKKIASLAGICKRFCVTITGTKGYSFAQSTAGGVSTREICANTMESLLIPGLYFAGEVVDIDGICGGYNLQWAFSSGFVAGTHAACRKDVP